MLVQHLVVSFQQPRQYVTQSASRKATMGHQPSGRMDSGFHATKTQRKNSLEHCESRGQMHLSDFKESET